MMCTGPAVFNTLNNAEEALGVYLCLNEFLEPCEQLYLRLIELVR